MISSAIYVKNMPPLEQKKTTCSLLTPCEVRLKHHLDCILLVQYLTKPSYYFLSTLEHTVKNLTRDNFLFFIFNFEDTNVDIIATFYGIFFVHITQTLFDNNQNWQNASSIAETLWEMTLSQQSHLLSITLFLTLIFDHLDNVLPTQHMHST